MEIHTRTRQSYLKREEEAERKKLPLVPSKACGRGYMKPATRIER